MNPGSCSHAANDGKQHNITMARLDVGRTATEKHTQHYFLLAERREYEVVCLSCDTNP